MFNVGQLAQQWAHYFLKSFEHEGIKYHIIGVNYEISKRTVSYAPKGRKLEWEPVFICSSALNKVKTFAITQIVEHMERRYLK